MATGQDRRQNTFSKELFLDTIKDYEDRWEITYKTLRELCKQHPGHGSMKPVAAKLWIIGRTYATQIERKVASNGSQGSALTVIAEHIVSHGRVIDSWLQQLPSNDETLTVELVPTVVKVHGELVSLLSQVTKRSHCPRSFASKYLHFHRPVVPIYDSVASSALRAQIRWQNSFDSIGVQVSEDPEYRRFVMRLLQLSAQANAVGVYPTVRQLDWYLMGKSSPLN